MSIRLRLTLLYSAILAATLIVFGVALYTIQARSTLDALKRDLRLSGENIAKSVLWMHLRPVPPEPEANRRPLMPFEAFSESPTFQGLREREIVRILDADGNLIASPFGVEEDALPLSAMGLQEVQNLKTWWEIVEGGDGRMLIYNMPVVLEGEVISIVQVARPLVERDRSLAALGTTLGIAGGLTILIAFGIGWGMAGVSLRPIHAITRTAQEIGNESDFSRRVDYKGPNDEVGQLAMTFNSMLARLQEAYQRVNQTLNMQRQFVADVSHELRTPLTTVRGNLALLRREPPLPEAEQRDILNDVVEESDRLIRLVNDLLLLARADAGRSPVLEAVELQPIIEEACCQAQKLDREREIVVAAQEVTALGDKDAIKQVLLILLDNAIKYSQGRITVSSDVAGDQAMISVEDGGPGMPSEVVGHVFERFYRGEVNPSAPGFGLGLPIAKSLVEGQGGEITIKSEMGKGSAARLFLPRPKSEQG